MTCEKCGYENEEGALLCEFCKSPLIEEKKKTVWDKLFIINILTCSAVMAICLILVIILYLLG